MMEYEGMTDQERRAAKWVEADMGRIIPENITQEQEEQADRLISLEYLATERDYGRY